MEIGIVTDEISMDVKKAFDYGKEWGVRNFELRNIWGKRVPRLEKEEVKRLKNLIDEYNVKITALSPGIFKIPLSDPAMKIHKGELLEDTFRLGKDLKVNKIIIFGIKREERDAEGAINKAIEHISEIVLTAEKEGFEILIENEPGCWADTAENTLKILKEINKPHFKLNWDPGNAAWGNDIPYPDGYRLIKGYVANVHFKDVRKTDQGCEWATVGRGEINWEGQLKALKKEGYRGIITIETHLEPLIENTRSNFKVLSELLNTVV